jgi:hypothetical protein
VWAGGRHHRHFTIKRKDSPAERRRPAAAQPGSWPATWHWGPAQAVFDTVDLSLTDWAWSIAIASSVLFLDEARKLLLRLVRHGPRPPV